MAKLSNTDDVVLGSGDLFIVSTDTTAMANKEIGTDDFYTAIEQDSYQIGHIQGGASLEYTCEWKQVKDDYKVTCKQFITNEDAKIKGGILAWNINVLQTLAATARVSETSKNKVLKIGGTNNANGKVYFIHFRHKRDDGKYIRLTIKGTCTNGFTIAFDPENETVLDPEFTAQGNTADGGTLIYWAEEKVASIPS